MLAKMMSFFSATSCKKDLKNGAARKFFGPFYFDPALAYPLLVETNFLGDLLKKISLAS